MWQGANLYINNELVTNLVIPDTVTNIKQYAFYGCYSLISAIIPKSVINIESGAFSACYSLIEIVNKSDLTMDSYAKNIITDVNDSYLKKKDDYVFYDDGTNAYLVKYLGNEETITLPYYSGEKQYSIYQYAFARNKHIKNVTIWDISVTTSSAGL